MESNTQGLRSNKMDTTRKEGKNPDTFLTLGRWGKKKKSYPKAPILLIHVNLAKCCKQKGNFTNVIPSLICKLAFRCYYPNFVGVGN